MRKKGDNNAPTTVGETLYALGYIRRFIEDYSRSCEISPNELTNRLANLLLAQTSGGSIGG